MFWETIPGAIATWSAAVMGAGYLLKKLWLATKWGTRCAKAFWRLIKIGTTEAWPNGSTDLPTAIGGIYERLADGNSRFDNVDDRLDHIDDRLDGLTEARRTPDNYEPPDGTPF